MFHRAAVHQCPSILFPCPVVNCLEFLFLFILILIFSDQFPEQVLIVLQRLFNLNCCRLMMLMKLQPFVLTLLWVHWCRWDQSSLGFMIFSRVTLWRPQGCIIISTSLCRIEWAMERTGASPETTVFLSLCTCLWDAHPLEETCTTSPLLTTLAQTSRGCTTQCS